MKKTMKMQQEGAWKDPGAIFNRVVREGLLEEGMRKWAYSTEIKAEGTACAWALGQDMPGMLEGEPDSQ